MRIILAILLISFSVGTSAQDAHIGGKVSGEKKKPLIAAKIEILDGHEIKNTTHTDANGNYRTGGLIPGRYTVRITHRSYRTSIIPHTLTSAGKTTTLDMSLIRGKPQMVDTIVHKPDIEPHYWPID